MEPGEVEIDEREVVWVVPEELDERIRKGMWRDSRVLLLLRLPLLMLVLGRRDVVLKERLGWRI